MAPQITPIIFNPVSSQPSNSTPPSWWQRPSLYPSAVTRQLLPYGEQSKETNFPGNWPFVCLNVLSWEKRTKEFYSRDVLEGKVGENDESEQSRSPQKKKHSDECLSPAFRWTDSAHPSKFSAHSSSSVMSACIARHGDPHPQIFVVLLLGLVICLIQASNHLSLSMPFSILEGQSNIIIRFLWCIYVRVYKMYVLYNILICV